MKTRRLTTLLVLALAAIWLPGYSCGNPNLIANEGFELWCDGALCHWELEQGAVQRVPTWHEQDYGVALVGEQVVLSQLSTSRVDCIAFELIIDKDDGVEVELALDFEDDGDAEYRHPIPFSAWTPVRYEIHAPSWYRSVRYRITKRGAGRAVLAQIKATAARDCQAERIELLDRPLGAHCDEDAQCAEGTCVPTGLAGEHYKVCSECVHDGGCRAFEVCTRQAPPEGWVIYGECVDRTVFDVAEPCEGDDACRTGLCVDGVCSTCRDDGDCPADRSCEQRDDFAVDLQLTAPHQCNPGDGIGQSGEPCLQNEDCEADICAGGPLLQLCRETGRACDNDLDCGGEVDSCLPAGVRNGVCY